mmetsp:Transcript_62952/g.130845  ORF Transcript_62952/g.130845 Transcript_62952/m.130845 type:complete len:268 (-) Transcript_62952:150-953(-)
MCRSRTDYVLTTSTSRGKDEIGVLRLPLLARLHLLVLEQKLRDLLQCVASNLDESGCAFFVVVRVPECDALANLPRPPRPPDAVDVALDVPRHVKVDHVRHPLDVQAPRCYIRCHHEHGFSVGKVDDCLVTLVLLPVPVDRTRAHAFVPERVGQVLDAALGVCKAQHTRFLRERGEQLPQLRVLLIVRRLHKHLLDRPIRFKLPIRVPPDNHLDGIRCQKLPGHLPHAFGPRGREQQRLPPLPSAFRRVGGREHLENFLDLRLEAHV